MIRDDDAKLWALFHVCWTTVAIVCAICYYNYSVSGASLQHKMLKDRERIMCIQAHGTWGATDNDGRDPYSCKFDRR